MLIIGDEEMNASSLSVRKKHEGDIGKMSVDDLLSMLNEDLYSHLN